MTYKKEKVEIPMSKRYDYYESPLDDLEMITMSALFENPSGKVLPLEDADMSLTEFIKEFYKERSEDPKYVVNDYIKPICDLVGGIHKLNRGLSLIDIKFVIGKKEFFRTSKTKTKDKIDLVEDLMEFGYIEDMAKVSINALAFLGVSRDHQIMMRNKLGFKTLADFYLMGTGKKVNPKYLNLRSKYVREVREIKDIIDEERDISTGIRPADKHDRVILEINRHKWW